MRKLIILCILSLSITSAAYSWEVSKIKDGIKIFTAKPVNSSFKAVKVECNLPVSANQLLALLLDINHNHEWVYNIKSAQLLKSISDHELMYHAVISTPWPFANRDIIAHLKVTRESENVITVNSNAQPEYIAASKDVVRIKSSVSKWTITTIKENLIKVEYTIQFDPGGNIPSWLINMFVSEGPYESFKNLKERVILPQYQNIHFNL